MFLYSKLTYKIEGILWPLHGVFFCFAVGLGYVMAEHSPSPILLQLSKSEYSCAHCACPFLMRMVSVWCDSATVVACC